MYVVKLPLNIGGKRRLIGELLDDSEVTSKELITSGYLVEVDTGHTEAVEAHEGSTLVELPVISEKGTQFISVGSESISEAVRVMQLSQNDAINAVKASTDSDMLIVLDLCESNKTIKAAIRKRGEELSEAGEAGDS